MQQELLQQESADFQKLYELKKLMFPFLEVSQFPPFNFLSL